MVVEDHDVQKKMRDGWQQGRDRMSRALWDYIPFATKPSNRRLRSRSRRSRRKSFSMLTGSSGNGSSLQSSVSSAALALKSATLEAAIQLKASAFGASESAIIGDRLAQLGAQLAEIGGELPAQLLADFVDDRRGSWYPSSASAIIRAIFPAVIAGSFSGSFSGIPARHDSSTSGCEMSRRSTVTLRTR